MKRKIVKQGNKSLTLTLPIKWTREKGLGEGDEIEVVPSGDYLILGAKQAKKRSISLKINTFAGSAVKKLFASLYRNGYDEISIMFEDPIVGEYLRNFVWMELVGFEIIKKNDKHYVIKDIAELDPESFDVLFKKSFLLLLNFKNEVIHNLEAKDKKALTETITHDREINKLTNLCQRLLNKKMNDRKKIAILALMLKTMEKTADSFKYLVTDIIEKGLAFSPNALKHLKEIGERLNQLYHQYYNFDLEKLLNLSQENRTQRFSLDEKDKASRYLHSLIEKIGLLMEGPLCLKINPNEAMRKEDWIA